MVFQVFYPQRADEAATMATAAAAMALLPPRLAPTQLPATRWATPVVRLGLPDSPSPGWRACRRTALAPDRASQPETRLERVLPAWSVDASGTDVAAGLEWRTSPRGARRATRAQPRPFWRTRRRLSGTTSICSRATWPPAKIQHAVQPKELLSLTNAPCCPSAPRAWARGRKASPLWVASGFASPWSPFREACCASRKFQPN